MSFRFLQATSRHGLKDFTQHSALLVISRHRKLTEVSLNFLKTVFPFLCFTFLLIIDSHELLLLIYTNVWLAARVILVWTFKYGLIFLRKFPVIIEDLRVSAVNAVKTLNGITFYGFPEVTEKIFSVIICFARPKEEKNVFEISFKIAFHCTPALAKSIWFSLCLGLT